MKGNLTVIEKSGHRTSATVIPRTKTEAHAPWRVVRLPKQTWL